MKIVSPHAQKLREPQIYAIIRPMQTRLDKKTLIVVLAAMLVLVAAGPGTAAQDTRSRAVHGGVHNIPDSVKLVRQISFLSDGEICRGRGMGSAGSSEAAWWIARQMRRAGLVQFGDSWFQHFRAGRDKAGTDKTGHNVIGMLSGSSKYARDSYVVIAAHYDNVGESGGKVYPGADSNASGVAAMLNLADMFSTRKILGQTYASNIIFVAFDAKEMSLAGSKAFWGLLERKQLVDPVSGKAVTPDKIRFMVNIDQIGSSLSPLPSGRPDYLIMLGNDTLPAAQRDYAGNINEVYGTRLELAFDYYGSQRFTELFYKRVSDQRVFLEHGRKAVMFTSGITMNTNKTTDTVGTLNIGVLRRRIIFIHHWLERMI